MKNQKPDKSKLILNKFLNETAAAEQVTKGFFDGGSIDHPEPGSTWHTENIYVWIFCEPWKWQNLVVTPKRPRKLPYNRLLARLVYNPWLKEGKGAANISGERLPKPNSKMSLREYLASLSTIVAKSQHPKHAASNYHSELFFRKLRSFLQHARDHVKKYWPEQEEEVFGGVFPKEWIVWCDEGKAKNGKIIALSERCSVVRNTNEKDFSISYEAACKTIKCLIQKIFKGRGSGQHTACEALGFLWVCLVINFLGVRVEETSICGIRITDLGAPHGRRRTHIIVIHTLSGPRNVRISKTLYDFLLSLPRKNGEERIFSKPLTSLSRTLSSCFSSKNNRPTFRNFLQPLHW